MEIQLNQVQINSVAHVVGKATGGCFTQLYHEIIPSCTNDTHDDLPQNQDNHDFSTQTDAKFHDCNSKLIITAKSLQVLNEMLEHAGYDQIEEEDDEEDRGLNLTIL